MVVVADTYLPLSLTIPEMTDQRFRELCEEYADYQLEYTAEGDLLIMPPTDPETGARNAILIEELSRWSRADGRGVATDSSAGFTLANSARRAPDAAWISRERFRQTPISPQFVIELLSPTDRPKKVHEKMLEWVANGVELAWLIDPRTQAVSVYRPARDPEVFTGLTEIHGEGPVDGFVLPLSAIWAI